MMRARTTLISSCCAAAFFSLPLQAAQNDIAANYPSKPVRFIVPFAPGAGTYTTARTISAKLSEKWHQLVVADNCTGVAGAIGFEATANANAKITTPCSGLLFRRLIGLSEIAPLASEPSSRLIPDPVFHR